MNNARQLMENLLLTENWNRSNLIFARYFKSNDAAILIGYLMDKSNYFKKHNEDYNGWFFHTVEQVEEATAISKGKQSRLLQNFKSSKLVEVKKTKTTPPKRYFKINYDALQALFGANSRETSDLKVAKRAIYTSRNDTHNYLTKNNLTKVSKEDSYESSFVANAPHIATNNKIKLITPILFDEFWELYPKRKGNSKAKALQSWNKICKLPKNSSSVPRPKWKEIKKAIKVQSKSERWQKQPEYIPLTSTWLNGYRWLDDAESLNVVEDYNKPKRTNTVGYQGGYVVTKESIKM